MLDGRARVLSDTGEDLTDGMFRGAEAMLRLAQQEEVRLAILMDISAACGSQVTYGDRRTAPHQIGQGVAAALLIRHGIPVVSQRDHRTLNRVFHAVDPSHALRDDLIDHHEVEWHRSRFEGQASSPLACGEQPTQDVRSPLKRARRGCVGPPSNFDPELAP